MQVGEITGLRGGTGRMAELHLGILFGNRLQVLLMTERIGENHVALLGTGKVSRSIGTRLGFRNAGLDEVAVARNLERCHDLLERVDKVLVIGGVFVVQADETDSEIVFDGHTFAERYGVSRQDIRPFTFFFVIFTAGCERHASADAHDGNEDQGKNLLEHCLFPPKKILLFLPGERPK